MKKILLVVFMALLVVNSAFSQVRFGVKAGANISDVSDVYVNGFTTSLEKDGMSVGFHVGVFANISLENIIGFQPELLFSMQGGKQKQKYLLAMDEEISLKFGYVQLPLLLEIKPIPLVDFGILVGPQIGVNISRKAAVSYAGISETISGSDFDRTFMVVNEFKKLDASLVMGLQYTFLNKITIGARYNIGFTNSLNFVNNISIKGWKNNVFQAGFGFLF